MVQEKKHIIELAPTGIKVEFDSGERMMDVLARAGIAISAPCGGHGRCGKCMVRLLRGSVIGDTPNAEGFIHACRATLVDDVVVELPNGVTADNGLTTDGTASCSTDCANIALDIGTTTIAAALVDAVKGSIVRTASMLNPQRIYGADVLGRITAAAGGRLAELRRLVLDGISVLIRELAGNAAVDRLVIAANTVMQHLLLGVDPSPLGVAPYTPTLRGRVCLNGSELGLNASRVVILPSASAYIGGDITAGAVALGMTDAADGGNNASQGASLLVDMGTNGEMLLSYRGNISAASTAAGPALEGACISCGVGGVRGAIDRISAYGGSFVCSTIGGAPAIGLTGSALVDLCAILLREGMLDREGAWNINARSALANRLVGDRLMITDSVYVCTDDIRQLQTAKSAIRSGIDALIAESGITYADISELYIAGGLGYYMNIRSAAAIGLLPPELAPRARAVGNSALDGAVKALLSGDAMDRISRLSERINVVELSTLPRFNADFINNMSF